MAKRCSSCDATYDDSSVFCDKCGGVLIAGALTSFVKFDVTANDYQTRADTVVLSSLEKVPVLPQVIKAYLNWWHLPQSQAQLLGDGVEISPTQLPEIHSIVVAHAHTLNIDVPRIFVAYRDPVHGSDIGYNAYTIGTQDKPVIFLSSATLDGMSHAELSFIIGHESGHIKSNHVLYGSLIGWYLSRGNWSQTRL